MPTITAQQATVISVVVPVLPEFFNGEESVTSEATVVTEVAAGDLEAVSEASIAWGPSTIDEELIAALDALRVAGYQPLPADVTH